MKKRKTLVKKIGKNSRRNSVTLTDNQTGKCFEFDLIKGSVGPKVIDIRELYEQTGFFTYDPGFTSTASCESKITYIDGNKGILLYDGYSIEELAERSTFLEVCYLLLYSALPNKRNLAEFKTPVWSFFQTPLHAGTSTAIRSKQKPNF